MNSNMDKGLKQKFIKTILKKEHGKETHYNVLTKEGYDELLNEVELAKRVVRKTALQYRRLKRFDICVNDDGVQRLIAVNDGGEMKRYLTVDEAFDVLEAAHTSLKHGGRDRMKSQLSKKYANVTFEMINLYIDMCAVCQQRKKEKKLNNRGPASNPLLEMNRNCQVDLIDLHGRADGDYKYVMVFQDLMTKYVLLQALKTDEAEEVADQLNDIFLTFGAPHVVLSGNGENFTRDINRTLANVWRGLHVIRKTLDSDRTQESVITTKERAESMIDTWMKENNSENWSRGVRFVQFKMNTTFHPGIKQSPYSALFGTEPRNHPTTTSLVAEANVSLNEDNCVLSITESEDEEHYEIKDNKGRNQDVFSSFGKGKTTKGDCRLRTTCLNDPRNDINKNTLNSEQFTAISRYLLPTNLIEDTGNRQLRDPVGRTCMKNGVLKTLLSRPPFELVECGEEPTMGYEEQVPPVRQSSILESILEKPKATGRKANRASSEKKRKRKEEKAAAATQTTNGDVTSHDSNVETLSSVDATQLKTEMQEALNKRLRVEHQNNDVVVGGSGASGSTSSEQFAEVLIKEEVMLVDAPMAKNVFGEGEELPIVEIKQESSIEDEYNPLDAAATMEEN